jgi:hypothetical protein
LAERSAAERDEMRHPFLIALGTLLVVGGAGIGVVLDRCALDWQAASTRPQIAAAPDSTGEPDVKHRAKQGPATLEDYQQALLGLWIQPQRPGYDPRLLSSTWTR